MAKKTEKKYHIITIGCQMNKSDSERFASYLESLGFQEASTRPQADLVVLNTCGVRQTAEDRIYGLIPRIRRENPSVKIILTGCLSQRKDVRERVGDRVDLWLPIVDLPRLDRDLADIFPDIEIDKTTRIDRDRDYLKITPKINSGFSAFVPIGNGCNNFCSYCVVPYARGREVYRPASEIVEEVKKRVDQGMKEVVFIAQNVNSYISPDSRATDFSELLKKVDDIPGDFWIRFATSHPKDMKEKLIKTIAGSPKICRHIHLPAQAGDNRILEKMNRQYTIEHYKKLIRSIKEHIPGASLTTDIIVGFPGETREQFRNTLDLFREVGFDMAYIAQFSPRPGTAAFNLEDDVPPEEKKRREEELMKILRKTALENNQKYTGGSVRVLVADRDKKGFCFGYTDTNKNVRIVSAPRDKDLAGDFIEVVITEAEDFGLKGEFKKE